MSAKTHGMTRQPDGRRGHTYTVWQTMRHRCQNPKAPHYARYGGRGITVCPRWETFEGFLADMGERPVGMQLDRIDNDAGYSLENCQWASAKANARNRSNNRLLTLNGETLPIAAWVDRTGFSLATLQGRVRMGWSDERVLTEPARARSGNRFLTVNGITKPLSAWCAELGLSATTVRNRLRKQGMTCAEALGIAT